jgi:hypothetical protein
MDEVQLLAARVFVLAEMDLFRRIMHWFIPRQARP